MNHLWITPTRKGVQDMGIADDARNKVDDLKGRAKEAAGAATGNDDLKAEGQADQGIAAVKQKVADTAEKVKDGVESIKDRLTGSA
ncbi:CsbD-like protein [Mycolicibacterium conceptionense]|uniref:CsbD-like protein n=4 Tax=Mycolicibacterium TaxID=1866885 RepID=A0A0U1DNF5_9MYCO|nr:CsbD-like protein [Mycolicibacterium conceptionense]